MNAEKTLELLFEYASVYKFEDFDELLTDAFSLLPAEELLDAFLIRAQIKLFAADDTLMDDLEEAERIAGDPRFPCMKKVWVPDSPNRFVVFKKTPGALHNFMRILPEARERLSRWYGEAGGVMARQVQSEILYFFGRFGDALTLIDERFADIRQNPLDAILALYVRFRCYLAIERHKDAEECMLDMIRTAKAHPECMVPYRVIRDWANLTTGWGGETPRFSAAPHGESLPVLEDRLDAIRKGISRLGDSEEPFALYAERNYSDSCTMRQHYMDIFHAVYWFQTGDFAQAEDYFMRAYEVSEASGLIMPFAEYGEQIVRLLTRGMNNGTKCKQEWVHSVLSMAEQYEESLDSYRA